MKGKGISMKGVDAQLEQVFIDSIGEIELIPNAEEYLVAVCCWGFLNENHTVTTVSEMIRKMKDCYDGSPLVQGMRNLKAFDFSDEELVSLMFMYRQIYEKGLTPLDYGIYSRHSEYEQIQQGKDGLLRRGIIKRVGNSSSNPERRADQKARFLPTPAAFGQLFSDRKDLVSLDALSNQAEIITSSSIQRTELFFNEINRDDVERLYQLLDPEKFQAIMDRLRARGRKASASCLLYGAPGTGKTELAKQLSLATGRDIVMADAAKLYSSYHGDTEKNVEELFEAYSYIQCVSSNAPILLFNEADGFLSKRTDLMRQAIDKIENRVQNILLQALEDFEGIFIATTNLADNIDPAFERRFLYKIEFQVPDSQTRAKIWLSKIPDLDRGEAMILASQYKFSGGQIDNVAKKRDIDEAIYDEKPSLEKMMNYCDNELIAATGNTLMEKIEYGQKFFQHGGAMS